MFEVDMNLLKKIKEIKNFKLIVILLVVGIALVILGGLIANKNSALVGYDSTETLTENKIRAICEKVDGVSDVTVAVRMENGNIVGVGIVCRGGGDAAIQKKLLQLVSAATGVRTNKIYITEAAKQ